MTRIIEIDEEKKLSEYREEIEYAAALLRSGGTVAFPTETVYGLGANAMGLESVKKIYEAKNRPADNPLIVHIGHRHELSTLAKSIPTHAERLMDEFWPGPLTLIFDKTDAVNEIVSGGLGTVAVRMPAHPIALELIRTAAVPVAAPSANVSGRPSPTIGKHVIQDLKGRVDCIVVSGQANVGLESTVLDVRGSVPVILRPGGVTKEMLERVVGPVDIDPAIEEKKNLDQNLTPMSPGMKYTHYSPEAEVIIVEGNLESMANIIDRMIAEYAETGKRVGLMCSEELLAVLEALESKSTELSMIKRTGSRAALDSVANSVFKLLRDFDEDGVEIILAEAYPDEGLGKAIMNRLNKAAGFNIVSC